MTPAIDEPIDAPEEPPGAGGDSAPPAVADPAVADSAVADPAVADPARVPSSANRDGPQPLTDPPANNDREPASMLAVDLRIDEGVDRDHLGQFDDLIRGVQIAAAIRGFSRGNIDVLITDDPSIRNINRTHLGHDYATDVISFGYENDGDHVAGEMVVSIDTARARALEHDIAPETELLLYVVHGALHICGMDDTRDADRGRMRGAEFECLSRLNIFDLEKLGPDWQMTRGTDPLVTSSARGDRS